jgi:hypothetical protein
MDQTTISPFKLLVTVIEAHNLPIADFSASNPYVVVSIGEKPIGRTKTITRNHLNSEWNEGFYAAVFHVAQHLELFIYDEDKRKADNLLGTVKIDLRCLPMNVMHQATYDITSRYKGQATLSLALLIGRKDGVFKIYPDALVVDRRMKTMKGFDELFIDEQRWHRAHELVRESLADFFSTPGCVLRADRCLMLDLLSDAQSLINDDAIQEVSYCTRNNLRLVNSTKLNLRDMTFNRFVPFTDNTIQIIFGIGDQMSLSLSFPNRFCMWECLQWLQLAYELWNGRLQRSELPDWASTKVWSAARTRLNLTIMDNQTQLYSRDLSGMLSLSLNKPHELLIDGDSFSLSGMQSLLFSVDCAPSTQFSLQVKVTISQLVEFDKSKIYETPTTKDGNDRRRPPFGVAKSVLKTVTSLATASANTASSVASTVVSGVASTAVNAARTIAAGNPM